METNLLPTMVPLGLLKLILNREMPMPAPRNTFKTMLKSGQQSVGCWLGMADAYAAEISATAGFDWFLIDGEHAPNDIRSMLAQLQVLGAANVPALIRPPIGQTHLIKQVLDIGCQTLIIPMVESAAQAAELVQAVRYPPHGVRGVGSALARASGFSGIPDYLTTANDEICVIAQVENQAGLDALDDLLAVEGIDGIFIGPSDLSADLGHIGQPGAPKVVAAIDEALAKIAASDKASGIMSLDPIAAKAYLERGVDFVAVGIDVTIFAKSMRALAAEFKSK